ncbi:hypothetical protein RSOLAG1IB_11966 [Rhizoctonia solani AG-1 IB]|uniref:Uncharacterized protein n=1 Tax=Thanatephorus cucumeris (strain AG1-IB / isolate 7/3/14) TaxID=1108050 RepID=A0A0B7FG76_THACB|nr:hypothetical protein RSOLAG1IB_11966 [Rhizoctonia solani AG-1 IB]
MRYLTVTNGRNHVSTLDPGMAYQVRGPFPDLALFFTRPSFPSISFRDTIVPAVLCHPKPSIRTVAVLGGPAETPRPPLAAPGPLTRTTYRTSDVISLDSLTETPPCTRTLPIRVEVK